MEQVISKELIENYKKWKKDNEITRYCFCYGDEFGDEIGENLDDCLDAIFDFLEENFEDESEYPEYFEIYTMKYYSPEIPYIIDDLRDSAYEDLGELADDFLEITKEEEEKILKDMTIFLHIALIKNNKMPKIRYADKKIGLYNTKTKILVLERIKEYKGDLDGK